MSEAIEPGDPRRRLALAYARREDRAGLACLWALDERLGAIVASTREEMLGRIRLQWWRDSLAGLGDTGAPAGEPLLGALASLVRAGRLEPEQLVRLVEGWAALLEGDLCASMLDSYASGRGGALFAATAQLVGAPAPEGLEAAGAGWALFDFAGRGSTGAADALRRAAVLPARHRRWPRRLRPLAVLLVLARTEQSTAWRRLIDLLRASLTGYC